MNVIIPWFGNPSPERLAAYSLVYDHLADQGLWPTPAGGIDETSVASARNRGATLTSGDVLVFNDADTIVDCAQVREAARLALEAPGLVYGYTIYVRRDRDGNDTNDVFQGACSFGSAAISRACFEQLGGFDEAYAGTGYEDLDFGDRAQALWPLRRVDGIAYHLWHGERHEDGTPLDVDRGLMVRNRERWLERVRARSTA